MDKFCQAIEDIKLFPKFIYLYIIFLYFFKINPYKIFDLNSKFTVYTILSFMHSNI